MKSFFVFVIPILFTITCKAQAKKQLNFAPYPYNVSIQDCRESFTFFTNQNKMRALTLDSLSYKELVKEQKLLKCLSVLASNGDTLAENYLLFYYEKIFSQLENKSVSNVQFLDILESSRLNLSQLNSKKAFEVTMKYFSLNLTYYDFIDYSSSPNDHFGLGIFHGVLLNRMTPESYQYYWELYKEIYAETLTMETYEKDEGEKKVHEKLYPIIKADWEAGKIKLKVK